MSTIPLRPALAWPFTVVHEPGVVWLIAGDDLRFSLREPGIGPWAAHLLRACDGSRTRDQLLAAVPLVHREAAVELLGQLAGERLIVSGPFEGAFTPRAVTPEVFGDGAVAGVLRRRWGAAPAAKAMVFCQESPDLAALAAFNRSRLADGVPWVWCTSAPLVRALVSPVFLPDAGPCAECVVSGAARLSSGPEVWAALRHAANTGQPTTRVVLPADEADLLAALVAAKVARMGDEPPSPLLFRLHVLERDRLEVTTHPVLRDAECPACAAHR